MAEIYNLFSFEGSKATFFISSQISLSETPILCVISIEEINPHADYRITFMDTKTGLTSKVTIHEFFLNDTSLYIMADNFLRGKDNILEGIVIENV